jgi:hypothetical protein
MKKHDLPINFEKLLIRQIYEAYDDHEIAEVSIIIPVFNQEEKIEKTIVGASELCGLTHEIIILNDCSSDQTGEVCRRVLSNLFQQSSLLKRVKLMESRVQLFETLCDHILIKNSRSEYIIEIQADIEMLQNNFGTILRNRFKENASLAMVSGRGIVTAKNVAEYFNTVGTEIAFGSTIGQHLLGALIRVFRLKKPVDYFSYRYRLIIRRVFQQRIGLTQVREVKLHSPLRKDVFPSDQEFANSGVAGRLGQLVDEEEFSVGAPQKIYVGPKCIGVGESCCKDLRLPIIMRGPLAIRRSAYIEVQGLDWKAFFLGFDDSDLCVKIHSSKKWTVAYAPIDFRSPLEGGSTRKKKSAKDIFWLTVHILRIQFKRKNSSLALYLGACKGL